MCHICTRKFNTLLKSFIDILYAWLTAAVRYLQTVAPCRFIILSTELMSVIVLCVEQLECSIPWLNESLILFTAARRKCQLLKDKVSVITSSPSWLQLASCGGAPAEVHHPTLYWCIACELLVYNYAMTIETFHIRISHHMVYKCPLITK